MNDDTQSWAGKQARNEIWEGFKVSVFLREQQSSPGGPFIPCLIKSHQWCLGFAVLHTGRNNCSMYISSHLLTVYYSQEQLEQLLV